MTLVLLSHAELARRFSYHAPDDTRRVRHEQVRAVLHEVAQEVIELTPPGREQSLAVTHLEEAMFWSNAAIAREAGGTEPEST